jgi:hypothetical protein
MEKYGDSSKIKANLPYDPAILLLGIYPKKYKSTYTCMFTTELIKIATL